MEKVTQPRANSTRTFQAESRRRDAAGQLQAASPASGYLTQLAALINQSPRVRAQQEMANWMNMESGQCTTGQILQMVREKKSAEGKPSAKKASSGIGDRGVTKLIGRRRNSRGKNRGRGVNKVKGPEQQPDAPFLIGKQPCTGYNPGHILDKDTGIRRDTHKTKQPKSRLDAAVRAINNNEATYIKSDGRNDTVVFERLRYAVHRQVSDSKRQMYPIDNSAVDWPEQHDKAEGS